MDRAQRSTHPAAPRALLPQLILLVFVSLHADPEMKIFGFEQFRKLLTDPYSLGVLGQTLVIGAETTALCLLLGLPLAWMFVRSPPWLRGVLILIILMPLLTSVVVRTFAWIVILGRLGIVNSLLTTLGVIEPSPARAFDRRRLILIDAADRLRTAVEDVPVFGVWIVGKPGWRRVRDIAALPRVPKGGDAILEPSNHLRFFKKNGECLDAPDDR